MLKIRYIIVTNLLFVGLLYSSWNGNIKFGHDTNIMKYSNQENSVSSNMVKLSQAYSGKISNIFRRETKYKLSIKNSIYTLSQKSNYSYAIQLKQPLGNYRYLSFNYSYIDDIYLRKYIDVDQGGVFGYIYAYEEMHCYFDNTKINVNYEFPIDFPIMAITVDSDGDLKLIPAVNKKSKISISYLYETQFYNKYFTEFDLEINGVKIKYSNNMNLFRYSISLRSINAENITLNDIMVSTSFADRGYLENSISLSLKYEKSGFLLAFNKRTFSSNIIEDHLHYNRTHIDAQYTLWRSFYLFGIKNKIFLKNRVRSTSSNYNWVEDLKTFDKYNLEHVIYF